MVTNPAALGRPTIHQIAARASAIISFEFRVEVAMPFIVAYPVVSFLRRRAYTKKHGDRAAEQRDELAAFHQQFLPCFEAEDSTAGDLLHCGISKEPLSAVGHSRTNAIEVLRSWMSASRQK